MLNYTAIDFETANSYRGSPCSVGLVRVRDGRSVEEQHWLIKPPEGADRFDYWNTTIHGITAPMVADAPRWKSVLPRIMEFIGNDVVVAHNAGFDIGVIRYACVMDDIEWPDLRFLCTLVMSRRVLALPSYRLPYVVESLGSSLNDHHDALADAKAVVDIVERFAALQNANDIASLAELIGVRIGQLSSGSYKGSGAKPSHDRGYDPVEVNTDADPGGYLYGRVVVFTGTLASMTRDIARQECAKVGAIPVQNTTKRTNVLVVGDLNPAALRPGSNLTGKTRKAFELQDKGQHIEVMTEDDFLRCLDGNSLNGIEVLLDQNSVTQTSGQESDASVLLRERSVPLESRSEPKPVKPPRPLRLVSVPTDQVCSNEYCENVAAFKTRTRPTWCEVHIEDIQRASGLRALEQFSHPNSWQLTECLTCRVEAHYRFNYTLDKIREEELTCRACFWRTWASESRALLGDFENWCPVPHEEANSIAEEHGYEYIGPLTAPSYENDPHHVKCRRCAKISAERLGDVAFGCTCQPRK